MNWQLFAFSEPALGSMLDFIDFVLFCQVLLSLLLFLFTAGHRESPVDHLINIKTGFNGHQDALVKSL